MIKPAESTPKKIRKFQNRIIQWGEKHFASFPWRNQDKPFHSLIVEILLQRTKAEQVIPVYHQFKKAYPSPRSLANAKLKDIERVIYPLGLKWRASNIGLLGQKIYFEYNGTPPNNYGELLKLPGVGPYAAGAYLSLHSGIRAIIPDANMVRILGRVFGFSFHAETRKDKQFLFFCEKVTPGRKYKKFNYAILDFGREICTPKSPKHTICPLKDICYYYKQRRESEMELIRFFKHDIPTPVEVIDEAINNKLSQPHINEDYIKRNFSKLVMELHDDAYDVYLKAEEEAGRAAIRNTLSKRVGSSSDAAHVIDQASSMFKEFNGFFLSLAQSRKSRAGKAFEVILKTLFKKLNYPFDEQQVINGKPDFLMPSRAHYDRNPMDCIIFTAKRTLRERWRQIVTEGTRGLGFYLATIDKAISAIQLDEMKSHRIYLVVTEKMKSEITHYHTAENVLTYEDFFLYHLDPAVGRWKAKKIIT